MHLLPCLSGRTAAATSESGGRLLSDAEELRWLLLNTALGVDGVHVKIKSAIATPLFILHVGTAERPGTVAYPRVIIEAAPGATGTVIEHHIQHGGIFDRSHLQ